MTNRPPNIVRKSALVPYSAERMFTLVDRVEDYPKFLPWCGGTEVKRNDDGTVTATIRIDYHGVRQSFTTHNKRVPMARALSSASQCMVRGAGQLATTTIRSQHCSAVLRHHTGKRRS